MDPILRVAQLRRTPDACLYCIAKPDTDEHVLAEAVGGRLTARIMCERHNGLTGAADKAFADHYAPLTFAASVVRQRGSPTYGKIGTTLRFVDAQGRKTTVKPDGRSEFGPELERNDDGIVQRGSGSYRALSAIAKNHPDPNGFRLFEVAGPGVTIPVAVGIGPESLPGYLKTALHFAAGFVAGPSEATVAALAPAILGERPARAFVQLPFRAPYFDPTGPIRHEVTIYPDGSDAVVTVMLFSSFAVTLALPHFATRTALRYVQLLDGTGPELFDIDPIPIPRDKLSDRELDSVLRWGNLNVQRIFSERRQRDTEEVSEYAARVAMGEEARHPGTFLTFYRAELERVPLDDSELVDDLVHQMRQRLLRRLPVFDDSAMIVRGKSGSLLTQLAAGEPRVEHVRDHDNGHDNAPKPRTGDVE
jgi:hypothetical protein